MKNTNCLHLEKEHFAKGRCRSCYTKYYSKTQYVAEGMCGICGKNPISDRSTIHCEGCLETNNKKHNERAKERKEKGLCISCGEIAEVNLVRCGICTERVNENTRRHNRALKIQTLEAYGGVSCACCGEDNLIMLAIDHINQDGAAHRREITGRADRSQGSQTYKWLKKNGFPPGYRVLCSNCNIAVFHDPENICPHRTGIFGVGDTSLEQVGVK